MRVLPLSSRSSVPTRRLSGDTGAAMVEFAIVAPILFLLIFGIYQFSLAYNAKVEITGAAREGARAAALRKSTATVVQAVKAAAPGVSVSAGDVNTVACPADPLAG